MSKPTTSLTLATNQVLHVHMSDPQQRLTYENLARHQLDVDAEKAALRRTYHLGPEHTAGRGYNDRLTLRRPGFRQKSGQPARGRTAGDAPARCQE